MSPLETFPSMEADPFLVRVDGLVLDASIGIYPHEKRRRQAVSVDLAWQISAASIATTDEIGDTIDYDEVVSCVSVLLAGQHFNLLETLTQRILDTLQCRFSFETLKVTVSKPAAIPAAKSVSVSKTVGAKARSLTLAQSRGMKEAAA